MPEKQEYILNEQQKSDLEKYALSYKAEIFSAIDIANSLRIHMIGGCAKEQLISRTGWSANEVEKAIKFLHKNKLISVERNRYSIDFDKTNINTRINQERAFINIRMFELSLIEQHFNGTENNSIEKPEIIATDEKE